MFTLAITPPGGLELLGILAIFILLFGARKLPDLGSSIGKSIKNFKRGMHEAHDEDVVPPAVTSTAKGATPASRVDTHAE